MSGFSIDWLDRREDADRRARDGALLAHALRWLDASPSPARQPLVVDLGAGTGSTLRALSAVSGKPASLRWRLVDHDRELLTEARRRHGSHHRLETCSADLAQVNRLPLDDARLVTASALFDLVSLEFIEALAAAMAVKCRAVPAGLYAALNYDGTTRWTPTHPLDEAVLDAFNRDQRSDKGFGPALGPDAGSTVKRVLTHAGYTVHSASSPWELDGADHALVGALIDGIAGAVKDDPALDPTSLEEWRRFRQSNVTTGTCIVGHTDVLAIPAV